MPSRNENVLDPSAKAKAEELKGIVGESHVWRLTGGTLSSSCQHGNRQKRRGGIGGEVWISVMIGCTIPLVEESIPTHSKVVQW